MSEVFGRPFGTWGISISHIPRLESLGYSHLSLRDFEMRPYVNGFERSLPLLCKYHCTFTRKYICGAVMELVYGLVAPEISL